MESGNESGSDSSSTNKKRVREADVARTHKPQPKRRNAMVDEKALEDLDDVEDVRIKGRYQASIEDDTDLKGSKRIRSILSTKSMFGGEYEKNMRKYSVELDSTPVSSSSKFQPRDLDIDLSYIPPLNDVKVRIAMLFGYSGYNAMVYCEDTSSSIVIEINSIKNFCNLEHGYEYTGLIRYGTPYTHGHMDGREDPFNISWPPQMTERDFLQPRKAQLQAFYGIMLYFLSSLRPALEAIYKIESTEDKIIFKPHIEINFVASQLICASEHIRDLITEFNEENQFNAKIIALTPTHVAVDGMASKFYGNTARAQSPNLPTLRPQNSQKPRYALLRRQDNLWVYDLNTAKSLDERDEDPSNSYSCPGEEGQWFSPSSVNSAIQEYLSMLTQRNIMWYDREDTVCMDIVPVLQEESIFSRYLGLPRHLKPWQDSFMEEFDWLLSEGDGCGPPQKLKISEGSDDSETNVCHEPGIRFYTTTDPSVAPFYTDVGFTTTEKVLKMTVNTLTKTIRKVADGSYAEQSDKEKHKPSHLQILKDRKSTGPAANRRNLREREGSSELPLVVLVGNIGDDATDHPLPLNMWNRVRNALDGEVDLQMYRGRDVVASVMGMDMIQNAQRRMTFDITTGRLWEYPNEVMREETAD